MQVLWAASKYSSASETRSMAVSGCGPADDEGAVLETVSGFGFTCLLEV